MSVPITIGSGSASVAAEVVSNLQYQQIEVVGAGGSSTLAVNPDGSFRASIIGIPTVSIGSSIIAINSGSVIAVNTGSVITVSQGSVITVWQASSVLSVPTGSTIAVLQSSSILAIPVGSVITVWKSSSVLSVPTGSTITVFQSSSILAVPVGSVITVWQAPSIAGTYSEDAAHATGDRGIFALGVRNDTLSSITSADGDYSPVSVGPAGALIAHDSPMNQWVQGTADLRTSSGTSVAVLAAPGASIFTYVREIQVANMGSASVLVTFAGGLGSILGYTIAPAGGGSNFITRLKTGANSAFTASISGTASVLVSAQGFSAKT